MIRHDQSRRASEECRGITLVEVLIVCFILSFAAAFLLTRMVRNREDSRAVSCLANLGQIGQAVGFYAQATGQFPTTSTWENGAARPETSVLWALRATLDLGDFANVAGQIESKKEKKKTAEPLNLVPRGLRCPSDRNLSPTTATNYRANTGSDIEGTNGPFAIGRSVTPRMVETADGQSFTAAFSERLTGNGRDEPAPVNYLKVKSCDEVNLATANQPSSAAKWAGDAGHDWSRGDWSQTLYYHGILPNFKTQAVGTDKPCGAIGASSAHPNHVNVLMLDGSAKPWRTSVDLNVWQRLGNFNDGIAAKP